VEQFDELYGVEKEQSVPHHCLMNWISGVGDVGFGLFF
jgi:hypothetical protein